MKLKYSLLTIIDLKPGDHLCCIYNTEKEHRAILAPFLRLGLDRGEKVLYITDVRAYKVILDYLHDEGIEAEPYLQSGQFGILAANEAYTRDGVFDPDKMITLLQNEENCALKEGYSALRVTGEMSWALRGLPGSERLIEYEAKLNDFFLKSKSLAICQYDRRRFKPDLLLDVLCTHPIAVIGTNFYDNFYYIPSSEILGHQRSKVEFKIRMRNLKVRKRTEEALEKAKDELEKRVEERTRELADANEKLKQEAEERMRAVDHQTRLEQQIRQMQKMEALGTLAGGIAHDLNNILMPIVVNAELALLDIEKRNLESQYVEQVLTAANRGKNLVNQIITFSQQKEIERKCEKIAPIIKEALKFLRSMLPETIEIHRSIKTDSDLALVNATQIHQVLINLCNNAADAMRDKKGVLEVKLAEVEVDVESASLFPDLKPGPYFKITVSDSGRGMDKKIIERIFDPFFTTKEPGKGTGMGLAVVHGIIKSHGGAIGVKSKLGKGSTFDVFLPRHKGEIRQETAASTPIPRGTERILLVDDDKSLIQSVQHMLKRLGYKVIGKTSSALALKIFHAQPDIFDLVITDMTMPHMTGVELANELLSIRPDIPIILCTGFSDMINKKGAEAQGIRELIMKPINTRNMAETIRRVLKGSA